MNKAFAIFLFLLLQTVFAEKVDSKQVHYDYATKTYTRNGKPFTGTSVIKDSQGNTVEEIGVKEGKLNGFDIMYTNGKVTSKMHYIQGVKEGKSYVYSLSDYSLYQIVEYKNDKKHGLLQTYSPEGYVESESLYSNGKRDGVYKKFFKNGKIKISGTYQNSKKSGKWIYYNSDGSIQRENNYDN